MFFAIISYFATVFFVVKIMNKKRVKYSKFPVFKIIKDGVAFHSKKRHRLKIENCRYEQMGKIVYVVKNGKFMQIKNIDNVIQKDGYLYFQAQGNVEIICKDFEEKEYFYLTIKSEKFNLDLLKQKAIIELINNFFNINFCKNAKKYLIIVKKVLKISIFEKKLIIKQNKFKFPFQIQYSIKGKNKTINLNWICV